MIRFFCFAATGVVCAAALAADGFVAIREGALSNHRIDGFEMLERPVTNAEYKAFVEETKFTAPLHWENGRVPAGMENHPVVYVNRYDVAAYLQWRTRKEDRVYRLPTAAEFEYAARAGNPDSTYPWGSDAPEGNANFDPKGERTFAQWREYLKPVKSYPPNAWGLYDMSGNVWQMIDSYPDPAVARFKYVLRSPVELENGIAGGSWARSSLYLRCGVRGGASAGIRHPDIGFRIVREPAGSAHFRRQPRRVAVALANGGIALSWQLLPDDAAGVRFHVYRSTRRDTAGDRITKEPIAGSTSFLDTQAPQSGRFYYRVRPVLAGGTEVAPSEWAGFDPQSSKVGLVGVFEPTVKQGGFVPVFGDLDGDGVLDAVIRLDNGIREMSRDPGIPVELEAFTSYGRSIWRRPLVSHNQCYGNANNVPVVVHDLNADGRAEVIVRAQEEGGIYLAVLDGMTGETLRKTKWTAMVSDFSKSSTRIHMSVAYLDGRTPAILTQTGLYENEIVDAYDSQLKHLWQFRSFAETNGSGSHHLDIADLDGDGKDEVLLGTTVLNGDGKIRWSIYREHPDIVAVKRFLPGVKDRQVFYAVESSVHAGAYLVDAKSGRIHWKLNREDDPRWTHAHTGWAADIWDGSPGIEMLTNRDGHLVKDLVLFSAAGKILADPFPAGWYPVNWRGGSTRELMTRNGKTFGRFTGAGVEKLDIAGPTLLELEASCPMVADLAGDYRDEIVCIVPRNGSPAVLVYTNTEPVNQRAVTRTASREYRLWLARNMGGGYPSYFEWEP